MVSSILDDELLLLLYSYSVALFLHAIITHILPISTLTDDQNGNQSQASKHHSELSLSLSSGLSDMSGGWIPQSSPVEAAQRFCEFLFQTVMFVLRVRISCMRPEIFLDLGRKRTTQVQVVHRRVRLGSASCGELLRCVAL